MNIKKMGLEDLSLSEQKNINGGLDYYYNCAYPDNDYINGALHFWNGVAFYWNCITGTKGVAHYIY